jgi:peptidoglycan biosynthesis protein MviN/MurJ (putative lipid II flippase)
MMLPYIFFFVGLVALGTAILNCNHTCGIPAATPILFNVAIISRSIGAVWKHFSNPAVSLAVGLNVLLNALFLRWLFPLFGNGRPALAAVVAGYFNVVALFAIFRVRHGRLDTTEILSSEVWIALCAASMGALRWLGLRVPDFGSYQKFLPRLGIFASLIAGATGIYLGLAWMLRCYEIAEFYGIATRREGEAAGAFGME